MTVDARSQSTIYQKLTVDRAQNAVEDLISSEQFIEGVTQALVDSLIIFVAALMKACTKESMIHALVQALKDQELIRVFLKSFVASIAERIAAEYSENTQSAVINALMEEYIT